MKRAIYSAQADRFVYFANADEGRLFSGTGEDLGAIRPRQIPMMFTGYIDVVEMHDIDEETANRHFLEARDLSMSLRFLRAIIDTDTPPDSKKAAVALLENLLKEPSRLKHLIDAIVLMDAGDLKTARLENAAEFPEGVAEAVSALLRLHERQIVRFREPLQHSEEKAPSFGKVGSDDDYLIAARNSVQQIPDPVVDIGLPGNAGTHAVQFRPYFARSQLNLPSSKRIFDVIFASSALVFSAPVLLVVALGIRFTGKGSVLFRQSRIGRSGRQFGALKFRTLAANSDEILAAFLQENPDAAAEWQTTRKLRNDPRSTRFGRFLRQTSLDELPLLINVVRGEMSLVGPRPLEAEEIQMLRGSLGAYFKMRPGVVDVAIAVQQDEADYIGRVAATERYAENASIWGDITILYKSLISRRFIRVNN